jgi:hypothetical protein
MIVSLRVAAIVMAAVVSTSVMAQSTGTLPPQPPPDGVAPSPPPPATGQFSSNELIDAGNHFFGSGVFWQGPSVGFDAGADGARTMMLVYNLPQVGAIFDRFGGINGSAYFIGGFGMTALTANNIVVVPNPLGYRSATRSQSRLPEVHRQSYVEPVLITATRRRLGSRTQFRPVSAQASPEIVANVVMSALGARCRTRPILRERALAAALVPLSFLLLAAPPTYAKAREEKLIPPLPIPHVARTDGAHPRAAAFSRPLPQSRPAPTASAHAAPAATPVLNKNAPVPIND